MNFSPLLAPLGLLLIATPLTDAKAFLESGGSQSETDMSDMLAMLLDHPNLGETVLDQPAADLGEAVRHQHAKDSHVQNQAALRSMFNSLPKNQRGNLGLPAARYALHRLFEHRHRWFVRGLHPKSNDGNADEVPGKSNIVGKALQVLTSVDKEGLSLPGLAALAGTLEKLIQREVGSHLEALYKTFGHSVEDAISGERLRMVAEAYMTIYISGADFRNSSKKDIANDDEFMADNTRDWTETQEWARSSILEAEETEAAEGGCSTDVSDCEFHFNQSTQVVKTVVEKYGHFNDGECHKLESKLLSVAGKRTGRVKLADFYSAGLSGAWEFNEKVDYLRSLGALDESIDNDPKVIVPNYVSSWVNCLSSSKFYAVCCRNDCEGYMQVIEKNTGGPMAEPDKIIRTVETQSAFLHDAPPNLSALRHRLVGIADRHHGRVPIHGRLFAQWMHHAFPSTCPYPHEAGKTNPQTPDEWMAETGHTNIKASEDEVHMFASQSKGQFESAAISKEDAETVELPWSDVEELLVVRPTQPPQAGMSFQDKSFFMVEGVLIVALVCLVMWMASHQRKTRSNKTQKF